MSGQLCNQAGQPVSTAMRLFKSLKEQKACGRATQAGSQKSVQQMGARAREQRIALPLHVCSVVCVWASEGRQARLVATGSTQLVRIVPHSCVS